MCFLPESKKFGANTFIKRGYYRRWRRFKTLILNSPSIRRLYGNVLDSLDLQIDIRIHFSNTFLSVADLAD